MSACDYDCEHVSKTNPVYITLLNLIQVCTYSEITLAQAGFLCCVLFALEVVFRSLTMFHFHYKSENQYGRLQRTIIALLSFCNTDS